MHKSNVPVIDLFAGAGGLGLGALEAGADLKVSVELDTFSCETLRANEEKTGGKVIEGDVCDLTGMQLRKEAGLSKNDPLVIVGGPPCQPFSKNAYWTDPGNDAKYRRSRTNGKQISKPEPITVPKEDERRDLVRQYWRLVTESNADGFLFENVPSLLHPRNKATMIALMNSFSNSGYELTLMKASATEFGVPQMRERIFLLGMKKEKPFAPEVKYFKKPEMEGDKLQPVGAGEVISKFDKKKYAEPEEVVSGKWEREFFEVPPGWNYKALTEWAGHPNPVFEAETRFWNFLLKLCPKKPSWTLAASPGPWTGPFHWTNRRLRTIEMAALQTFPEDYKFIGSRRERVRQIGNAVPVTMAEKILTPLLKQISGEAVYQGCSEKEVFV